MGDLAGIVLAGGAARRLSGLDKPMLEIRGKPLLRHAIDALAAADPVIVVGPQRPGVPDVVWTREEPPGGGPVAALAAGLALVHTPQVAVLAGDLVTVTASTVDRLRAARGSHDGAVLVDGEGHRQWLIALWRTESLRAALPDEPGGASLRRVLGGLDIAGVEAAPGEGADVDTPAELARHTHSSQPSHRP